MRTLRASDRENFIAKMKREKASAGALEVSSNKSEAPRTASAGRLGCLALGAFYFRAGRAAFSCRRPAEIMSQTSSPARTARRVVFLTAALVALSSLRAQPEPQQLERYITTATRTPAAPETLGSAVAVISADDLARSQIDFVAAALGAISGAPMFSSGARGSVTSLFLRGANSDQTLFLVDGIRLNDPNTDYQVFLGGATLGAGDRIEIARGPQSTLYGADAIGGVISLGTARGAGLASSSFAVEAGSFGTIETAAACQGAQGANAWSFSASGGHTDNARPNNHFDSANIALRVDRQVTESIDVGGTLRWFHGDLGSPGDRFTNDPNDRETESNLLATTFVDAKLGPDWTAHATLGAQDRRYVDDTPAPNAFGSPSATEVVTNRRGVVDAQTTYSGIERNRLTVGTTSEANYTRNTGFGAIDHHQRLFALFADDEYSPVKNVHVTGGIRNDDFDTFGHATTGRATLAWLPVPDTIKLRASYGTGFRAPSFLDLYGRNAYYVGNPNVTPERSRGTDAGVDYYLPQHRGTLSATWFQTNTTNLIDYNFAVFPSTVVNVGRARTQGVELSARTTLSDGVEAFVNYTYLDAQALLPTSHIRLLRRPQQQVSADVHRAFGGFTVGGGLQYVGRRDDVDAQTYATIAEGGFTVARVYAAWQATPALSVKARVENVLDRHYEAVNGYPALGAGAFGGVEWKF